LLLQLLHFLVVVEKLFVVKVQYLVVSGAVAGLVVITPAAGFVV
jgi:ammonia channel protein AmtB